MLLALPSPSSIYCIWMGTVMLVAPLLDVAAGLAGLCVSLLFLFPTLIFVLVSFVTSMYLIFFIKLLEDVIFLLCTGFPILHVLSSLL